LVNITTKQQIVDIFNLTKTTAKDAKISFFNEYHQVQKNYTFSREALEEIYLIYIDKALLPVNATTDLIKEKTSIIISQNGGTSCTLTVNNWTCNYQFVVNQKPGYNLTKALIYFNGQVQDPTYGAAYKAIVDIGNTTVDAKNILDISTNVLPLTANKTFTGTIRMNVNAWTTIIVGVPESELIYEKINKVVDEESYGELRDVSTEKKIDTTYTTELNSTQFNTGTTSTSTIIRVTSPVAFSEMTSIGATTSSQIKSLFNSATSTLGKDAKLYHVYKTIKDTKNIELTRLTLEEMWNINIDRQLPTLGSLSTTTTTVTPPTPIPSNIFHKMDGSINTTDKRKDELNNSNLLLENGASSITGKDNQTDTGYQINGTRITTTNPNPLTNQAITQSIWIKTTSSNTGFQRIVSMDNIESHRTFLDLDIYQGKPYFEIGQANPTNNIEGGGTRVINDSQWHKIDYVVQNNPNTTLKVYVDGTLDRTLTTNIPYNLIGINNELNLGGFGQGASTVSPFTGQIDNFKYYNNKALTDTEILREYQIDTNTLPPVITTNTTISQDVFNRDRYTELELISPISLLKYAYDVQTVICTWKYPLPINT
jgi:hypothetical protein